MKRPPEIPINQFQLAILLDEERKQDYKFCSAKVCFAALAAV